MNNAQIKGLRMVNAFMNGQMGTKIVQTATGWAVYVGDKLQGTTQTFAGAAELARSL